MLNLISFVKLFPDYQKMQIVHSAITEALTARVLADHAADCVRSATVSGDTLVVFVIPDPMPPVSFCG